MLKQYRNIEKGEFLVAGYDMATGANDYCAVQFISKTKQDVPLVIHSAKTASDVTNTVVRVLEKIFDLTGVKPVIAPETNAGGVYEIDRMLIMNRENKYEIWQQPSDVGMIDKGEPRRYGWTTNLANRAKMLSDLKQAIDNRILKMYDKDTVNELYSFVVVRTVSSYKAQAEKHARDDLVMALAIAYQVFLSEIYKPTSTSLFSQYVDKATYKIKRDPNIL